MEDILLEEDSLVSVLEVHILRCRLRWCSLDKYLNYTDDFNFLKRVLLIRKYSQYLPTPLLSSQQSALLAPLAQPFIKDQNHSKSYLFETNFKFKPFKDDLQY